jgi:hypothetical protein
VGRGGEGRPQQQKFLGAAAVGEGGGARDGWRIREGSSAGWRKRGGENVEEREGTQNSKDRQGGGGGGGGGGRVRAALSSFVFVFRLLVCRAG